MPPVPERDTGPTNEVCAEVPQRIDAGSRNEQRSSCVVVGQGGSALKRGALMYQPMSANETAGGALPTVSYWDKLTILVDVLLPTIAKGILLRRPLATRIASRFDADKRAVRRLQKIRDKYGDGPVLFSVVGRQHALVLEKDDLQRVLKEAPVPFTPASDEKSAALRHFEPHVSLISAPGERVARRRVNDAALESRSPNHSLAESFIRVAQEEAEALIGAGGELTWTEFSHTWDRIVRRVVLGDHAREDTELSSLLKSLRADGNWSFLKSRDAAKRNAYIARLGRHLVRAEPGSLAAALAKIPKASEAAPWSQATHWIFAFDAGAIAAFSSLALLATHDNARARAEEEARRPALDQASEPNFPFLRSCLLEALRLWPTTMIVHRQTTAATSWGGATMAEGTSILLFAPYFHRDDRRLPFANRFAPEIWMDGPGITKLPLIPFSGGPGECPGRHVVLLVGAALLAHVLRSSKLKLLGGQKLDPARALPGTLNHFSITLRLVSKPFGQRPLPFIGPQET
jgi:cytochrome P450